MKNAVLLLISGIATVYAAAHFRLDIYVLLSGVCVSAGAITYGYLLLVKQQYERMVLEGKRCAAAHKSTTRPAA
ncbi:MAG: hypothetical protein ACOC2P_00830 [Spirochaetota bacterium]